MLAIAARRGNATAPGFVLLVLALQILLSLAGVSTALTHGAMPTGLVGLVIALLVAAAVFTARDVLVEMKKRGLWETKFAAARPSRGLCVCGGIILVAGYLGFAASLFIPVALAAQNAKEVEHAKAFLACIRDEEPQAIDALQNLAKTKDSKSLKAAISKVDALDRKVASIQREVAPDVPLAAILAKYRRALADWKSGLAAIEGPEGDAKKAKQLLQSSAALRAEAAREFNRRYPRR